MRGGLTLNKDKYFVPYIKMRLSDSLGQTHFLIYISESQSYLSYNHNK